MHANFIFGISILVYKCLFLINCQMYTSQFFMYVRDTPPMHVLIHIHTYIHIYIYIIMAL